MESFDPELIIASPGRINLIGEHTDYNMGYVLPTAIDKKITFNFRKNETERDCNIYSAGFDARLKADLSEISRSETEWENYILGVLHEISKRTDKLRGFDCSIESNLPLGSGVSSSAAMECGLAFGLNELFHLGLGKKEIVTLSQQAEHSYVGTQCGIMDQFASVMSREGHVILLDCKTLAHSYIPIAIHPYKILLLNTHVSHNLASSEYNTRRKECEEGVAVLQKKDPALQTLRDASIKMLAGSKAGMSSIVYNRCRFIIEENDRVLAMAEALKNNNLKKVGALLYEGHTGLSALYGISCPESDFLVDFSRSIPEVLGARQMGGGFGGCTINLVEENEAENYIGAIFRAYREKFNIELTAFDALPSEGTAIVYKK